jgi:serine phosphatase RsbU (regulator of sigma subunit)
MVQLKLLPREHSRLGRYEFSRCIIPSMYSSGDFVDYFEVDDHHLAFYVADVSGHGVSSAFVTVWLKSFMANALERYVSAGDGTILQPAALLSRLNSELIREDLGKYVTMFYGVIQRDANTLSFANGGQFPFPLLCSNGRCEVITARSWLVGLFDFAEYVTVERELPSDFAFLIFSDGVLQVLPQDGLAEKLDALKTLWQESAHDVESVVAALGLGDEEFPPDDITFFVVQGHVSNG